MKIVSSGRVLNSPEFFKKKKRKRRIQLILLSIGFLAVLSSLIYFSRQEQFSITEVVVLAENAGDKEEMAQIARHLLADYYLWVVPRNNIFFYPRHLIRESLLDTFPRLKSVDLDIDEHRRLSITVRERVPFALYCPDLIYQIEDPDLRRDACFFLDEEGFVFAPAPSFSDGVYLVYVTEEPIENPVSKRFVTAEEFKLLSGFIEILAMLDIQPSTIEIGNDEYRLSLFDSGQIIWRRASDPALVRSNLEAFLSDDSIRTQNDFFDKMLYLDLRTENKVFWKVK